MRRGDVNGKAVFSFGFARVVAVVLATACGLGLSVAAGAAGQGPVAEPDGYRTEDYRAPVPHTLAGARVVDGEAAERIVDQGKALLIDVFPRAKKPPNLPEGTIWRDPKHKSIKGAYWLPNVGYGVLSEEFETYFKSSLARLTSNDKSRPLMFFCQRDCWMSWNAAKRALGWGYTDVIWFPDGTDAWLELGHGIVNAEPFPE